MLSVLGRTYPLIGGQLWATKIFRSSTVIVKVTGKDSMSFLSSIIHPFYQIEQSSSRVYIKQTDVSICSPELSPSELPHAATIIDRLEDIRSTLCLRLDLVLHNLIDSL